MRPSRAFLGFPDTAQTSATPGMGAVAIFDENGTFLRMAAVGVPLAAPWGLALAPAGFGPFSGDLLVGNFSFIASEINAMEIYRRPPKSDGGGSTRRPIRSRVGWRRRAFQAFH
jgi:hypothetical protein